MGFVKQWKGVNRYMLNEPGTFFDKYDEVHGIGYPLVFMLVSYLAVMVPIAVLSTLANISTPEEAAMGLVAFLIIGLIFWLLGVVEALIAHGVAMLFGARGVATSLEAYAFPTIVRFGLWWFPIVNVGLAFYGLFLQVKALATFHDLSGIKAGIAAAVAVLLYLPAFVALVAVIATFLLDLGSTAGSAPPM